LEVGGLIKMGFQILGNFYFVAKSSWQYLWNVKLDLLSQFTGKSRRCLLWIICCLI